MLTMLSARITRSMAFLWLAYSTKFLKISGMSNSAKGACRTQQGRKQKMCASTISTILATKCNVGIEIKEARTGCPTRPCLPKRLSLPTRQLAACIKKGHYCSLHCKVQTTFLQVQG